MYNKVELPNGFVGLEKEITNLWTARNVIKKNFDMNQDGEYFTFYDGPPTANGRPHVGHVLTRVMTVSYTHLDVYKRQYQKV